MNEIELFNILDKECGPDSCPIPLHKIKCCFENIGFMVCLISYAFREMRETQGKSNWEIECTRFQKKEMGKSRMTRNAIRKAIMNCLSLNYIKDVREVDNKIYVTINVKYLFEDMCDMKDNSF